MIDPSSRKRGRPTELTPEVRDRLALFIKNGAPLYVAAEAAGIARDTLHDWMRRGGPKATPEQDPEGIYGELFDAVTRAMAEREVAYASVVHNAAAGDWRAAAWLLERLHRESWGKTQTLEHTGPGGGPVQVQTGVVVLPAFGDGDGQPLPDE